MNTSLYLLITQIDAELPQTQCGQCGYAGCKPYATAIAQGQADINQCPPGADQTIQVLSGLLGVAYRPLNPQHGVHKAKSLALINEAACIGCTLCIAACPVDAIVGAAKQMHTVIAEECTGCGLCIAPCPVDCIAMQTLENQPMPAALRKAADLARTRHEFKQLRLSEPLGERRQVHMPDPANHAGLPAAKNSLPSAIPSALGSKKAAMVAALAKAKAQAVHSSFPPDYAVTGQAATISNDNIDHVSISAVEKSASDSIHVHERS